MMFQTHGTDTDLLERTEERWRITERYWEEPFISGPFGKVERIPEMPGLAGLSMDGCTNMIYTVQWMCWQPLCLYVHEIASRM
jgi:hypothetical protein